MMRRLCTAAALFAAVAFASPPPAPKAEAPKGPPPDMPHFTLKPVMKGKAPENPYSQKEIARGEYLVRFGSCDDCHTPKMFDPKTNAPMPEMARRLSGHPEGAPIAFSSLAPGDSAVIGPTFTGFKTPFGEAYAANLTPDMETGSGKWTEEQFVKIFRTGKHLGTGRPILPPMPWASLAKMSDDDLKSIFAFLRSLPPVKNAVPQVALPDEDLRALDKVNSMMMMAP